MNKPQSSSRGDRTFDTYNIRTPSFAHHTSGLIARIEIWSFLVRRSLSMAIKEMNGFRRLMVETPDSGRRSHHCHAGCCGGPCRLETGHSYKLRSTRRYCWIGTAWQHHHRCVGSGHVHHFGYCCGRWRMIPPILRSQARANGVA
jgi:hypothetical protein